MASPQQVELVRRALATLSSRAQQDFLRVWSGLDPYDFAAVRKVLDTFWPELIGHYGEMAAALAADDFVLQAAEIGLRGEPQMVRAVDPERALARMRWAIGTGSQLGNLQLILDELVKQPYRSTMQRSASAAGGAWARVPSGAETCAWCLMLASRGAVYETARSASTSGGRLYHGDCDCTPVLAKSDADLPYDVEKLFDIYSDGREAADSGSTKKILAEIRARQGTH